MSQNTLKRTRSSEVGDLQRPFSFSECNRQTVPSTHPVELQCLFVRLVESRSDYRTDEIASSTHGKLYQPNIFIQLYQLKVEPTTGSIV